MNPRRNLMLVVLEHTNAEYIERTLIDGNCDVTRMSAQEAVTAQTESAPEVVVIASSDETRPELTELVAGLGRGPNPPPILFVGGATDLPGSRPYPHFVEHIEGRDAARLLDAVKRGAQFRALQLGYRDSQARLLHASGLATLGSMVAGVAHEIKTPLSAIRGNNEVLETVAERVRDRLGVLASEHPDLKSECEETCEVLDDSVRTNKLAIERLLEIVKGASNIARVDDGKEVLDIRAGIDSSLILLAHEVKGRIEVIREFADVPDCECCPGQICQVLLNLLVNASQAIEGRGTIRIRTWEDNDTVRVAISDDGPGISEEVQERIFDAGFTTKSSEQGSGLGLSISRRIVQNHGGSLEVKSRPGTGTTFTMSLPRTPKSD